MPSESLEPRGEPSGPTRRPTGRQRRRRHSPPGGRRNAQPPGERRDGDLTQMDSPLPRLRSPARWSWTRGTTEAGPTWSSGLCPARRRRQGAREPGYFARLHMQKLASALASGPAEQSRRLVRGERMSPKESPAARRHRKRSDRAAARSSFADPRAQRNFGGPLALHCRLSVRPVRRRNASRPRLRPPRTWQPASPQAQRAPYRTGIEGRINHLKRRYGLRRSRLKGDDGMQIWTS